MQNITDIGSGYLQLLFVDRILLLRVPFTGSINNNIFGVYLNKYGMVALLFITVVALHHSSASGSAYIGMNKTI